MSLSDSQITRFYNGKTVLVTGGTGFIGKVLVEKLLRSTDVKKILLLLREKRGKKPIERLQDLTNSKVFQLLKEEKPDFIQRLDVITGDLEAKGLGLNDDQKQHIIDNVEVVLHCAATVRFNEELKKAVLVNVGSVYSLLKICKSAKKLEALVHVSTAYCNCHRSHLDEDLCESAASPLQLLSIVENQDSSIVNDEVFTQSLVGERPNTYTFTKAVAEELVYDECTNTIPACIVRPSIVASSWKEPFPGWVDSINGPIGLFLVSGIGVLRTAHLNKDFQVDGVPVDSCANIIIAAAWQTHLKFRNGQRTVTFYNHISTNEAPLYWKDAYRWTYDGLFKTPFEGMVWYPRTKLIKNRLLNQFFETAQHTVPAYIVDVFLAIFRRKPYAVKMCDKMHKAMRAVDVFLSGEWSWSNENTRQLINSMDQYDKEVFCFDLSQLDWRLFLENQTKGTRTYMMNQSMETVPACKVKLNQLYILDCLVKIGSVLLVIGFVYWWLFGF